ncbi:MAG: Hemolysin-type calcium binding domain protein, partial [Caulobacteraceae bacterium]|nr:Hemolysin-type calcium binding domain protein [Caulobacteraceae bacterium]
MPNVTAISYGPNNGLAYSYFLNGQIDLFHFSNGDTVGTLFDPVDNIRMDLKGFVSNFGPLPQDFSTTINGIDLYSASTGNLLLSVTGMNMSGQALDNARTHDLNSSFGTPQLPGVLQSALNSVHFYGGTSGGVPFDETFDGSGGDDTLQGNGGHDVLIGHGGNDLYINPGQSQLVEQPGEGVDTVWSDESYQLPDNVENLVLTESFFHTEIKGTGNAADNGIVGDSIDNILIGLGGNDSLNGDFGDDSLDGGAGNDQLYGGYGDDLLDAGAGDDQVYGDAGDDTMFGGAGVDHLYGGDGADIIDAGAGADQIDGGVGIDLMIGGAGSDTYQVDDTGDVIIEQDEPKGIDTVFSSATYTLSPYIEILRLTGKTDIDGTGNDQDNYIYGNDGENVLTGHAGNDYIDGGRSDDVMIGNEGDDTYIVNTSHDVIVEQLDEGHDVVFASETYVLSANIEDLTLTGTSAIDGAGNEVDNVITGNAAANLLSGGEGADTLIGGAGDDTYFVDQTDDTVVEKAGQGTDTVLSSATFTLSANVENLVLTGSDDIDGTGNSLVNIITGNAHDNVLDGRGGADVMAGGRGDDSYYVDNFLDTVTEAADQGHDTVYANRSYVLGANVEDLYLGGPLALSATGNGLDNMLVGNEQNNILDGLGGADLMIGGSGNDLYYIDNIGDVVVESAGGTTEGATGGIDTVRSSVSFTLSANVENLTLTGLDAIDGTGNGLANTIIGNAADNVLDGGQGGIRGLASKGGIIVPLAHDTLIGGAGNDTYIVRHSNDVIKELAGEGTDTVTADVSYTLSANVENIVLLGEAGINATGNSGANILTGNSNDNILDGKAGADVMYGGQGNDTFYVDNAGDLVVEDFNEGAADQVFASISYSLTANVENLTLTGSANLTGHGNDLDNILIGNSGKNLLDGGAGADAMYGGAGNDAYLVDNAGDQVFETIGNGLDTVLSFVDFTLGDNLE